jgi:tRNA U34 5-carboxymethylaminomethyl modifying GTPase MnmE/TrmE
LQENIVAQALGGGLRVQGEVVTQARHHQHLGQCLTYLRQARGLLDPDDQEAPWELVALEFAAAIHELGEITGEEVGEAVLDRIFGQFCLGK